MLIWVACGNTGTLVVSGPELLPGVMSEPGSMQLWYVLMSVAHVGTGVIGTMLCWAIETHHWLWDGCP